MQKIKDQGIAYVDGQSQQPIQEVNPAPTPAVVATPTPVAALPSTPTPVTIYLSGVFINEILPAPEGADDANEYIEIYNSNATDVDVSGWKLQDAQGTPATYVFSKDTKIPANGYMALKRPETKITLNNDEDGLNLISPDEKIVDSVSFTKAPKNQSYNKINANWQWSSTLTAGSANIINALAPKTSSTLSKAQKTDSKYLSALSEPLNPTPDNLPLDNTLNPWFLFLIALALTIICATIVLLIKLKIFKKSHERS